MVFHDPTLRHRVIQQKTLDRYFREVVALAQWAVACVEAGHSFASADELCTAFVEALEAHGHPQSRAATTMSALAHFVPPVRGALGGTWRTVRAWKNTRATTNAEPLPEALLMAAVALFAQLHGPRAGLALLVGYRCALRPGELCALWTHSLAVGGGGETLSIVLGDTKMSLRTGTPEAVSTKDPLCVAAGALLRSAPPAPLLGMSYPAFLRCFKRIMRVLGAEFAGFAPHSIRRGGACRLLQRCGDITQVMLTARWQDLKTARIYIDLARYDAVEARLSLDTHEMATALEPLVPELLLGPSSQLLALEDRA